MWLNFVGLLKRCCVIVHLSSLCTECLLASRHAYSPGKQSVLRLQANYTVSAGFTYGAGCVTY